MTRPIMNQIKSKLIKIYIFFYMIYKVMINLLYASYIVIYVWEDDLSGRP